MMHIKKPLVQRTIYIDGQKIVIKSRPKTYMGNFCGFNVWINNEKIFKNCLTRQEAEDKAYITWLKNKEKQ